jgi:sulfur-oxidizing protein SoxX
MMVGLGAAVAAPWADSAAPRVEAVAQGAGSQGAALKAPVMPVAPIARFVVAGDAIEAPLDGRIGDPARGQAVVRDRETGNCLICHSIPVPQELFQGEIAPPLAGVGARLSPAQIRLRVVDPTRLNPRAIMPAYHRIDGLQRVDARWAGRPVLDAQAIEDVVAYLSTLGN